MFQRDTALYLNDYYNFEDLANNFDETVSASVNGAPTTFIPKGDKLIYIEIPNK